MQKWAVRTKLQLEAAVKMGKVSNSEGHHLQAARREMRKEYLALQMPQVCGVILYHTPQAA